ncbi:MAG: hypothetical protein KC417_08365, partial [Myxococcales bacterium]|nr:hypothetical protein [Myxococcales bacterium]
MAESPLFDPSELTEAPTAADLKKKSPKGGSRGKAKRPSAKSRSRKTSARDQDLGDSVPPLLSDDDDFEARAEDRDSEFPEAVGDREYDDAGADDPTGTGFAAEGADASDADDGGDEDGDEGDDIDPNDPRYQPIESKSPIRAFATNLSDRAIQRITGGNAFLRGRIYARRGAVEDLALDDGGANARISVKNIEEPYLMKVSLDGDSKVVSECNCQGWRGPTGHCKHVAALLVALRDRERPPRPKGPSAPGGNGAGAQAAAGSSLFHVPQTVSVGGKRRRSRRRGRRGEVGGAYDVVITRDYSTPVQSPMQEARSALDTWLPSASQQRPYEFEYRLQVRSAAITVTPVLAGSRSAVPIPDALSTFGAVSAQDRPLLRALARNVNRGKPSTAELRGEDAAELLGMLKGRRVLLEPASMELRFSEERLRPRIELDASGDSTARVRVVFEIPSGTRRFSLSNGAWFEGTPGWHIDTMEGVARPLAETVTPAWLQRLYRSPSLVHPISDLPYILSDFVPRVAASLGADLPDLASVADLVDAQPSFTLKGQGDIVDAHVRIVVKYGGEEFPVPSRGFPSPLAFLPPLSQGGRPRVVRRDVGGEMAAIQQLLSQGFEPDESGEEVVATGENAIRFWTQGMGELPAEWERFIPDDLVDVKVRGENVTPQMRVASGVDWLSLDMVFSSGGVAVDAADLRACLEKGRHVVKLSDGTYAPVKKEQVGEILARLAEIESSSGGVEKLPLSQAGRVQDLVKLVDASKVTAKAKTLFDKLDDVEEIDSVPKPRNLKASLRDYQKRGFAWLVFIHNLASGGILADDMGLGKTLQTISLLLWAKQNMSKDLPHLVVAPTSVVPNWQREIEKFAPSLRTLIWQGQRRHDKKDEFQDVDVVITSYALLRRDEEFLSTQKLGYVILDEAQH